MSTRPKPTPHGLWTLGDFFRFDSVWPCLLTDRRTCRIGNKRNMSNFYFDGTLETWQSCLKLVCHFQVLFWWREGREEEQEGKKKKIRACPIDTEVRSVDEVLSDVRHGSWLSVFICVWSSQNWAKAKREIKKREMEMERKEVTNKLLVTSASLLVTSALLVVTRSY